MVRATAARCHVGGDDDNVSITGYRECSSTGPSGRSCETAGGGGNEGGFYFILGSGCCSARHFSAHGQVTETNTFHSLRLDGKGHGGGCTAHFYSNVKNLQCAPGQRLAVGHTKPSTNVQFEIRAST